MKDQLGAVKAATYLLEGNRDLLFPCAASVRNTRAKLSTLKDVVISDQVCHGIETYPKAMNYIGQIISALSQNT